jgi:SAM-dependent methyltransferase
METIPKNFHFITGLDKNFGGKPFGFIHYMAIRSAMELNPEFTVYVYYQFEPSSPYWDLVKNDVITVVVEAPSEIFGRPVTHFAHKADILRLQFLLRTGGVYLDLDTICQKPFAPLMHSKVVMGIESSRTGIEQWHQGDQVGLCNAVIISCPDSAFLKIWFETYKLFDANNWNNHSVLIPAALARTHPNEIHIEPPESFFWPLWTEDGIASLFIQNNSFPEAYSFHLWESLSWGYAGNLTVSSVIKIDTTYNCLARQFIQRDLSELLTIERNTAVDEVSESRTVFTDIYTNNRWGQGSGSGSAPAQNLEYRLFIEKFLIANNIKSVLDFGCGDWQFSRLINWGNVQYNGVDLVASVVESDNARFKNENINFTVFSNIDDLPSCDLVICKDVLQHISLELCIQYLEKLKNKAKYLLITNDINPVERVNIQIQTGGWRPVHINLPPFNYKSAIACSWYVHDALGSHQKATYLLYGDLS